MRELRDGKKGFDFGVIIWSIKILVIKFSSEELDIYVSKYNKYYVKKKFFLERVFIFLWLKFVLFFKYYKV